MSGYEMWFFTDDRKACPSGLVAVEDAPDTYGWLDAQMLARSRIGETLGAWPADTRVIVREPGAY